MILNAFQGLAFVIYA